MSSLSKILFEFSEIMEKIEENGGEITDEILPVLSAIEMQVSAKVDRYVAFVDTVRGQIDRTKKNIEKFKDSLKTLEALETRLKDNVKHNMEAHKLLAIKGDEREIKLINSGGVQATEKPSDMFYQIECVHPNYFIELKEYLIPMTLHVIADKEKFKQAIKDNKFHSCYLLPRSKYVKFI